MTKEQRQIKLSKAREDRNRIIKELLETARSNTIEQVRKDWALIESVRKLRDDHEYSQQEIADMVKIPRHWVRSIIYRFCINR